MALFSMTDAQLAFGHVALLDHTDFALEAGERVGLIGRNGTGKSSLLKIIAGLSSADDGLFSRQQGLSTAYVAQEPTFDPSHTVYEVVAAGLPEAWAQLKAYDAITAKLGEPHSDEELDALMNELHALQTQLDAHDAWNLNTRVETTLAQLHLPPSQIVGELSGGTQKRVALAQALVAQPDVLLLDEPTNHLDINAIAWLENLLINFKGSILLITHDRSFLDRVATRIIELDRGRIRSYPGNFTTYQTTKAQQLEMEAVENAKFDKLLAQEEVWIRKGVEARRTRSVARIGRLQEMRLQREARREVQGNVKLDVGQGERSGKIVAELENVSKAYNGKTIVRDFTATLMRGDKVGLIGPNGAGKTTLLKLILDQLEPDTGTVKNGSNLQIAYFDQMRSQLNMEASLADTISPGSEWVEVNGNKKHVMSYLADFLFAPERARSPVKSLSGGERNRLLLARLFAKPANVLVLDEPTNDLDIETLELLEELLQEFDGTVFLVSHDRTFLDNVVTSVIVAEGAAEVAAQNNSSSDNNGAWREYVGGYNDWLIQSERAKQIANQSAKSLAKSESKNDNKNESKSTSSANNTNQSAVRKTNAVKLNNKEQRELDSLPNTISELEKEQAEITALLASGEIYTKEPEKGAQLAARHAEIDEALLVALERWESLEAKRTGA